MRGGIYGTAANLRAAPDNPTLENNGSDVRYETDFRSVYAQVIDSWLGADSAAILGADFRGGAPAFCRRQLPSSSELRRHASSQLPNPPFCHSLQSTWESLEFGVSPAFSPQRSL